MHKHIYNIYMDMHIFYVCMHMGVCVCANGFTTLFTSHRWNQVMYLVLCPAFSFNIVPQRVSLLSPGRIMII